jgi:hypothetical protein
MPPHTLSLTWPPELKILSNKDDIFHLFFQEIYIKKTKLEQSLLNCS